MCRVVHAQFRRGRSAATRARHLVVDTLKQWDMSDMADMADTAALLTDELVANAVLHARSPVRVTIAAAHGSLEVGVTDLVSRRLPRPRRAGPSDPLAVGGRGMWLVESMADAWGTSPLVVGKQVWFRLDTAEWPWAAACVCGGDDLDRVRLGSGSFAVAMPQPWHRP